MNLEWTAEQEELRASVRRFLAEQGPGAKLSELGLFGLLVPEALGGAGLGMLELGVVLEEAGRALHAGPFVASALGATRLRLAAATLAEQRELLPALATGERRAAVVGLAPGAAFHAHGGRLSGAEPFALEAGGADLLLVAADVPEAEQCGWLKDQFGLSWQVSPPGMQEMMKHGTPEQIDRVTQAFLPMKKFDIAELRAAYEGR